MRNKKTNQYFSRRARRVRREDPKINNGKNLILDFEEIVLSL